MDESTEAWQQVSAALVTKNRRLAGRDGESDTDMGGEGADSDGGESDDDDDDDETDN